MLHVWNIYLYLLQKWPTRRYITYSIHTEHMGLFNHHLRTLIFNISAAIFTKWHERLPVGIPWAAEVFTVSSCLTLATTSADDIPLFSVWNLFNQTRRYRFSRMFKPRRMKRQGQDGKVAPGGSSHSNHLTADWQRFGIPPEQKQKTNNQEDFDSDLV